MLWSTKLVPKLRNVFTLFHTNTEKSPNPLKTIKIIIKKQTSASVSKISLVKDGTINSIFTLMCLALLVPSYILLYVYIFLPIAIMATHVTTKFNWNILFFIIILVLLTLLSVK